MKEGRFCTECSCSGEPEDLGNGKVHQEKHWACPLFGGVMICETCCQVELAGGMGAPDTLRNASKRTEKSPAEIHATCVACPHGGPELDVPPKLLTVRGSDGKYHESGPEFEAQDQAVREGWIEQLNQLKNDDRVRA